MKSLPLPLKLLLVCVLCLGLASLIALLIKLINP